jgi:2-hydroxy-3-oxopropionate reductase
VLEIFGKRMVEKNFTNGIDARLYHKDLNIVLGITHELGVAAPAASLVMQNLNALMGRGLGENDLSVLIELIAGMGAAKSEK